MGLPGGIRPALTVLLAADGSKTWRAERASCRNNRRPAGSARLTLTAINLQLLRKIARLPVALQEILQRRPALLN